MPADERSDPSGGDGGPRPGAYGVSRALHLVVTSASGIAVPEFDYQTAPEVPLGPGGVLLLDALLAAPDRPIRDVVDEIAARVGADAAALWLLVDELVARDLLVAGLVPPPTAAGPEPAFADVTEPIEWYVELVMPSPVVFPVGSRRFEYFDHHGELRARLSAVEFLAAGEWRGPATVQEAYERHVDSLGDEALAKPEFRLLARRLLAAGLLGTFDPANPTHNPSARFADEMREALQTEFRLARATEASIDAALDRRVERADHRPTVVPINTEWRTPPSALGLVVAYAQAVEGGALDEAYDFLPSWYANDALLPRLLQNPGVFLFSNYIWIHAENLERSAQVKAANPANVTIHGGPDTPKYDHDLHRYFASHPHIDITVRGEGEAALADILLALRGHVGDGPADLSVLAEVPGISFRHGDEIITTGPRDRIAEVDAIPSPWLLGMFDDFAQGPPFWVTLESNRGCPYGCTFCDWGSATLSRIRKFSMERILAELEWCAAHQIKGVGLADANFGIFERDVEIAQKIVDLKSTVGYPQAVGINYAKNTVKHLARIIEMFASAGITVEGTVSLQSMDETTLVAIRRKNIKVEQYDKMAVEFRKNDLPLTVELMMGLPGATVDSFRDDLQECADRGVRARVNPTFLLPNSPMNDPAYRAEHGITASAGELVRQTSTYTEQDYVRMEELRRAFLVFDRFGVLRQVAFYVRAETGMREIDFYERLLEASAADPERWPALAFTVKALEQLMVPPGSWSLLLDEVRRFAVEVLGLADDDALRSVLAAQLAVIPARNRAFPEQIQLAHNYAAWFQTIIEAKESGHRHDWEQHVPPLRTFGPAPFTVDDPEELCLIAVGLPTALLSLKMLGWDLDSPVARAWVPQREVAGA